ncbi:unnamed protein product [Clonostachys chloroleuca]|uniref:Uncharacterized protein n=1 Tax=Clonostachys chloroleuca TaxID=1926264 RepID=A0AA35Q9F9_9HYPO|nr:unnamed protein product [Clonostachys chloroleuca]
MGVELTRRCGSHGYIVSDRLILGDVIHRFWLENEKAGSKGSVIRYLHVYCDTLEVFALSDNSISARVPQPIRWLRVFARSIIRRGSPVTEEGSPQCNLGRVTILWNVADRPFKLFGHTLERREATIGHDFTVSADGSAKLSEVTRICSGEFDTRHDIVDMLKNVKTIEAELPTLVRRVLSLAVAGMNPENEQDTALETCLHKEKTKSRLTFVSLLTRNSPSMADVSRAASTLLFRLTVPEGARIWVPKHTYKDRDSLLKDWLAAARQAEEDYKDHNAKIRDNRAGERSVALMRQITKFQHQDASLDLKALQDRYERGMNAVTDLAQDFASFKDEMARARREFNTASQKWEEDRGSEAQAKSFFASVELIAAIAITVYTLGAASGSAVNSSMEVADAISMVKTAIKEERTDSAMKKAKKILSAIEKMNKGVDTAKKYLLEAKAKIADKRKSGKTGASVSPSELLPPVQLDPVNYFELLNQWDDYMLDNDAYFAKVLKLKPHISEADNFQLAVKKVVGRARNMLAAQKELQSVEDKMRLAMAHVELRAQRESECEKLADSNTDAEVIQAKLELGLKSIRLQVFLLFHEAFCAHAFEGNLTYFPTNLKFREDKLASEFFSDVAALKSLRGEHPGLHRLMATEEPLRFRTPSSGAKSTTSIFDPLWMDLIISEGRVPFRIPTDHVKTQRKCLASITKVSLLFEGIQPSDPDADKDELSVPLMVEFGPHMVQLEESGAESKFLGSTVQVQCQPSLVQKVGTSRKFYSIGEPTMRPTLYTTGFVRIRQAKAKDGSKLRDWDLNTITAIQLELHTESWGDAYGSD